MQKAIDYIPYVTTLAVNFCRRRRVPFNLIPDFISESHLLLVQSVKDYDPSKSTKLITFITLNVKYRLIDYYRRQFGYRRTENGKTTFYIDINKVYPLDVDDFVNTLRYNGTEEEVIKRDLIRKLFKSLSTDKRRSNIYSYFFEDKTMKEIAEETGVGAAAVSFNVLQSLSQMRRKADAYKW